MNEKELKFFKGLHKAMQGGAVQPDELIEAFTFMLKLLREQTTLVRRELAEKSSEGATNLTTLTNSIKELEASLRSLIADQQKLTAEELKALNVRLLTEIEAVESMIPAMPDLASLEQKVEAAKAELESKIPKLPEELTPAAMWDKLENLEGDERPRWVSAVEKKLTEIEERLTRVAQTRITAGPSANAVQYADLTAQCDGSKTSFEVPRHRFALALFGTQFPGIYRPGTDFTTANRSLSLVTSQVSAPASGQTLVFLYIK